MEIVGVSRATVFRVKKCLEQGEDLSHKHRGPPSNKKMDNDMLEDIRRSFETASTTSMRKMAMEKEVNPATMRNAVKQLGMASRVRPH